MDDLTLKQTLLKTCGELVNHKIAALQLADKEAQEAANNETKSSAGDKYETGRAMAHLEKERIASQLNQLHNLQKALSLIKSDRLNETITVGSVVFTPQMNYYISVGLGAVEVAGQKFFCISPVSPIGKIFLEKAGDGEVSFQGRQIRVEKVI